MSISDYSRSTNYIWTKESGKDLKIQFFYIYYFNLVPLIQPDIDSISTNQPCQIDIYLKNFNSIENNTRFKVLIKSISNEQSFEKSYHSIGDGPLPCAYYFHMQSPPPLDISINLWNVTVLSSREIFIKWNINQILTSIGYRIRWIDGGNSCSFYSL